MTLHKCPKCELNYISEGQKYCEVCMGRMRRNAGLPGEEDEVILCIECGEAPIVPGEELCAACLKEQRRQAALEATVDVLLELDQEDIADEDDDSD